LPTAWIRNSLRGLASETDDDPGRELARAEARQRIEMLKLREKIAAGENDGLPPNQDIKQKVEFAKMLLVGLNSNRINPVHIEVTRQFVKQASQMKMQDAYSVLSWWSKMRCAAMLTRNRQVASCVLFMTLQGSLLSSPFG